MCLALIADTSLSVIRVIRELDAIIRWRGRPATIVSDNGTELTSMAVLRWSQVTWRRMALLRAGYAGRTPSWRASTVASGASSLNDTLFSTLAEARSAIAS